MVAGAQRHITGLPRLESVRYGRDATHSAASLLKSSGRLTDCASCGDDVVDDDDFGARNEISGHREGRGRRAEPRGSVQAFAGSFAAHILQAGHENTTTLVCVHRSEHMVHRIKPAASDGGLSARHGDHPKQRSGAEMLANLRNGRGEQGAQMEGQLGDVVVFVGVQDPPQRSPVGP